MDENSITNPDSIRLLKELDYDLQMLFIMAVQSGNVEVIREMELDVVDPRVIAAALREGHKDVAQSYMERWGIDSITQADARLLPFYWYNHGDPEAENMIRELIL